MRIYRFISIIAIFTLFTGIIACKKKEDAASREQSQVIRIGEVGSMTGGEATFGISTHRGIELAIKEVNAKGGVKGKKLELISLDDQGKPEEAATAVTKLITQNRVTAILGEVASSRSLAMAPIAQQNQIPMISPSSTNPRVTEQGDYIFRVCFIDPFQGYVMAKFARENLSYTKVAILRDVKNDYSVGLADYFTKTFVDKGGEIVVDQSYSAGDIDFKSQLTAIRATSPQAIFVPGYYTEVGLIARQAKELGLDVPLLGGDGWDSPKLKEIGGINITGSYFSNHYSNQDTTPHVQKFVAAYKKDYGDIPDGLAAMGYDAALVLIDAMNRAPSFNTSDLRDAIAATKDYAGVTGTISIDSQRNAVKSAVVLKVEDEGFRLSARVEP